MQSRDDSNKILMKFFFCPFLVHCWCNALFLPVHSHLSVSVCAQVIEQHLWNDTERMESEWKGSDGNCNNRSNIIWLNCHKKGDWERDGDMRVERERDRVLGWCVKWFSAILTQWPYAHLCRFVKRTWMLCALAEGTFIRAKRCQMLN